MSRTRRQIKWLTGGVSVALITTGGVILGSGPSAHAAIAPGQGSSYAQGLAVAPHDGSLAVGVTLAEALAGHTNSVARAQSQGIDLGAIGTSMTGYNCGSQAFQPDQIPQSLQAETGQQGADQGFSQQPDPSTGTSQPSFGTYEHVQATATPYGEADTSLPPITTAAFRVDSMATNAWSGLKDGQRVAGATATIGGVDIANGLVQLHNLRWDSQYPSGGSAQPTGTFTIGGVTIGGTPLPATPDLGALQQAINQVLGQVGLQLQMPTSSVTQGVQSVTPLEIDVVPNDNRDNVINPGLNTTEPVQQTVFSGLESGFSPSEPAQLAQALCNSDTPITVAQVAIASVNGGGFFSAALGGVHSSSSDLTANPFDLSGFSGALGSGDSLGGSLGGATLGSGSAGSSSVGTIDGSSSPSISSTPQPADTGAAGAAPPQSGTAGSGSGQGSGGGAGTASMTPASTSYAAGGPLLAIGLAGLALLGLLAEIDRRMMRRAQHTVQFEE